MPNLQASPRNEILGYLADLLQSGKSTANQYEVLPQVPLIGGTGLGDLFMGKAPELFNDMSYYGLQAAMRGGNVATGGIGTYGARPAVADAILLGMDLVGLGKGLGSLSKKSATAVYDKLINGTTSLSRREALKKIGGISGGAAVTGGGVGLLRKFADNAATSPKSYMYNTLEGYINDVKKFVDNNLDHLYQLGYGNGNRKDLVLKEVLDDTEQLYSSMKSGDAYGFDKNHTDKVLNAFSPRAKQEMNDWQNGVNKLNSDYGVSDINGRESSYHWTDWVNNSDDVNETLKFLQNYLKHPN